MSRRSQLPVLMFSIIGILVYWVASLYLPMPPITSEQEALTAVMHYLKNYPELSAFLAGHETSVYYDDEDGAWSVSFHFENRLPGFVVFNVNKITGFVKPVPLR